MWNLRSIQLTWRRLSWTTSSRTLSCSQGWSGTAAWWWAGTKPRRFVSGHFLAPQTRFYVLRGECGPTLWLGLCHMTSLWISEQITLKIQENGAATNVGFFFFFYLQESHWGHVGWGKDEKNQIHRGRSRCLFWSDCALAGWCRRSSPSEVVSLSSLGILYPGTCSKGSAFSTQTHWCEGQSTEPQCRPHRPAEDRRRRTWEPVETLRFHIKIFSISISLAFHQNPFRDWNIV